MKYGNRIISIILASALIVCLFAAAACSTGKTTEAGAAAAASAASALAAGKTATDISSDAFSKRDLSGEYDKSNAANILLEGSTASSDSANVSVSGSDITITGEGTYIVSGKLDNGSIIVNASKEEKIQLVLDGAEINSSNYAAICVVQADKVFITLAENTENSLSNGGTFVQRDDHNVDSVIFSRDDLTLNGTGSLTITSPNGHGIVGKDELVVTGGAYVITAGKHGIQAKDSIAIVDGSFTINCGKDALHAENDDDDTFGTVYISGGSFVITASSDGIRAVSILRIDGGSFEITAAEGLESTYVLINDGDISIVSSDDGINASKKSSAYYPTVEINGGSIKIEMGRGDTDGIDSNGNLIITGGSIDITGQSAFDFDGTVNRTGGTVTVNGQTVTEITGQMMGGPGGPGGPGGQGGGRWGRRP